MMYAFETASCVRDQCGSDELSRIGKGHGDRRRPGYGMIGGQTVDVEL